MCMIYMSIKATQKKIKWNNRNICIAQWEINNIDTDWRFFLLCFFSLRWRECEDHKLIKIHLVAMRAVGKYILCEVLGYSTGYTHLRYQIRQGKTIGIGNCLLFFLIYLAWEKPTPNRNKSNIHKLKSKYGVQPDQLSQTQLISNKKQIIKQQTILKFGLYSHLCCSFLLLQLGAQYWHREIGHLRFRHDILGFGGCGRCFGRRLLDSSCAYN